MRRNPEDIHDLRQRGEYLRKLLEEIRRSTQEAVGDPFDGDREAGLGMPPNALVLDDRIQKRRSRR